MSEKHYYVDNDILGNTRKEYYWRCSGIIYYRKHGMPYSIEFLKNDNNKLYDKYDNCRKFNFFCGNVRYLDSIFPTYIRYSKYKQYLRFHQTRCEKSRKILLKDEDSDSE